MNCVSNDKMIRRVLNISSLPRVENVSEEQMMKRKNRRKVLKIKLLTYFGLGLVFNIINGTSYILALNTFRMYFMELAFISACGLAAYMILNLYFLDVLKNGILKSPNESKDGPPVIPRPDLAALRINHEPRRLPSY
jgi:hypothetical protein